MKADTIDLAALKAAGVVPQGRVGAKVILAGKLTRKVTVKGIGASKGARAAIEAAGGSVVDIKAKPKAPPKPPVEVKAAPPKDAAKAKAAKAKASRREGGEAKARKARARQGQGRRQGEGQEGVASKPWQPQLHNSARPASTAT